MSTKKSLPEDTGELVSVLKSIDKKMSFKRYAVRGFIQGVFQFLGATVGIAILFFIVGRILDTLETVPLINFIEDTELVHVIREAGEQVNE
ncbi:hypothetical protein KC717_02920 [Candidatus Dojkabacteria bacterium]|uniref:Uncharacterized protein n=1 Tax=Candidatus Dojkabacteria bacterium TaxID=2099670 RepID=A0A955L8H4_9BACT|nr:hypothetical protein [Candidatus Dojkabacteria bacterium]